MVQGDSYWGDGTGTKNSNATALAFLFFIVIVFAMIAIFSFVCCPAHRSLPQFARAPSARQDSPQQEHYMSTPEFLRERIP